MDELSERKAKQTGDVERQLASYFDNCPSESTTTTTTNPDDQNNQPVDMLSSTHTENDVDSMTSSISPPPAPAPAPIIINEEETEGFSDHVDDMLTEQEKLRQMLQQIQQTLEQKQSQLTSYFSSLPAKCFFGLQINNKLFPNIIIKLFDNVAPRTCSYFRSIISGKRGYDFQNAKFDYLVVNKYCEGGEVIVYKRGGVRICHTIKEETNNLIHNREGLISMDIKTMRFGITLGPMPSLDNNHKNVIFGEIETGMEIMRSINASGIQYDGAGVRRALEANVVHNDDSHAVPPFDTVNVDSAQPGADDVGGDPMDNIVIYTCGQQD